MSDPYLSNSAPRGEGTPSARFLDEERECVGSNSPAIEHFFALLMFGVAAMIAWCLCKFFSAPPIICNLVPIICGGIVAQHMLHLHKGKS